MHALLAAVVLLIVSGFLALMTGRFPRLCTAMGVIGAVAGCALGLVPALGVVIGGTTVAIRRGWDVPYGSFSLALDPLSAWFVVPILGLSGLAATYGAEYLDAYRGRKSFGAPWFFFNLLVASMVLVVLARNGVLFLVAWELMSLASYFLVTFEDEDEAVRDAGRTYLIATHLGTAFLLAFFVLLGGPAGSLDFDAVAGAVVPSASTGAILFLLAVVGFGAKAGFMPLHVWLPEAHPAAPSHVSAVMSGVMVKVGIYGLVRALTLLPEAPAWWGWLLIGIGIVSGIWGVLFAIAQHDLKRLLAYHTVENIGIIALGLGIGLLGASSRSPVIAVLGVSGALLHVVNHALFKGLLFLGAGSIAHATGTRDLDLLGGLSKRMPWVAGSFIIGAVAIVGLPPLNGFASEFLIYLGAFRGEVFLGPDQAVPCVLVIAALALIGGLAALCFTKVVGVVFLGEPRTEQAAEAHRPGWLMVAPQVVLAAGCLLVGLTAPWIVAVLMPIAATVAHLAPAPQAMLVEGVTAPLFSVVGAAAGLLGVALALAIVRRGLLKGRPVGYAGTWDCGYARPGARMQYTASSYVQPATTFFAAFLRTRRHLEAPAGLFPKGATFGTETADVCTESLYRPAFGAIGRAAGRLRWLQHGRIHIYIMYIALTLVVLLVWSLGLARGS
jgi:formate hydrogenlyase subunit 3/multisubunit Na+/H+ antiporter MnhD subunit